jgi:hypothetical protein
MKEAGFILAQLFLLVTLAGSNPSSKPYVPFQTSPFEHPNVLNHELEIPEDNRQKSKVKRFRRTGGDTPSGDQCPLQFNLGLSQRTHQAPEVKSMAIIEPPSIFPVHPSYGPGRQVVHTTQYEHLDLLTPSQLEVDSSSVIKEGLQQHPDYPLLFESSSFLGSVLVHDVNGDGIPDAVMADYDGGLYFVGLQVGKDHRRYLHRAQIPRLYVRRDWMVQRLNETNRLAEVQVKEGDDALQYETNDPYHSYFEYGSHEVTGDSILRGVAANVLGQGHADLASLEERRKRKVTHEKSIDFEDERSEDGSGDLFDVEEETKRHRRLQQDEAGNENAEENRGGPGVDVVNDPQDEEAGESIENQPELEDAAEKEDQGEIPDVEYEGIMDGEGAPWPDDDYSSGVYDETPEESHQGDDENAYRYGGYDDYYDSRYRNYHNDYYDDKHYIRIPPHILGSPVLADMKKAYSDNDMEREEMIFLAVSYYFDEDEYEGHFSYKRFENVDKGDETEIERGMHVASAIVAYIVDATPRFGREEHLDLSGDPTAPFNATLIAEIPVTADNANKMAAFALAPPTIADIDGNGDEDVIIGTSMGIIYCLHARHMYNTEGWPVQVKNPIESRILLEDVTGDTNLEIFVLDNLANVYCFDCKGQLLWRRDLLKTVTPEDSEIRGLSPMTMGDVNGDGVLDLAITVKVMSSSGQWGTFLGVISAVTGDDVANFPMEFDSHLLVDDGSAIQDLLQKLPPPLLIDLHADQGHWKSYLYRNGTKLSQPEKKQLENPPHGGSAPGLHVVQPVGSNLYIVEGGSGCTQIISIGEEIAAMVQADDVHGTNNIDLVISTKSGNIVTLDSPAVPYHPLNVWNSGEVRSRRNNFAQGYSASQGIFVHDVSRQYRDIFGVYLPVTFEIFDNRPNIQNERDKRVYHVEFRDGTSAKRALFRKVYNEVGVFTERLYISFGPGYYTLTVLLRTTHGLIYEDTFHLGYNVHYMDGFGFLLWFPLFLSAILIVACSKRKATWDDEEFDDARGRGQGILGATNNS